MRVYQPQHAQLMMTGTSDTKYKAAWNGIPA
jgi:hypothetical protein